MCRARPKYAKCRVFLRRAAGTKRRIRLFYGDAYGVTVTSRVNMGTMIAVRVPMDFGEEAGEDA